MDQIKNKHVIEKIKELGHVQCSNWLYSQYTDMTGCSSNTKVAHKKSFESCCKTVYAKYRTLVKSKNKAKGKDIFESFLDKPVQIPKALLEPRKKCNTINQANINKLQENLQTMQNLAQEIIQEKNELKAELEETKTKSSIKLSKVGNLKLLKERSNELKLKLRQGNKKITCLEKRLKIKATEIKRLRSKLSYEYNNKLRALEKIESLENTVKQKEMELNILRDEQLHEQTDQQNVRQEFNETLKENEWLRELTNNSVQAFDVTTKSYTPALQECVFELLGLNVSQNNVSKVIQTVLNLVNCKANKLPCPTTVNNMNIRRLSISHTHLSEVFADKNNTCLLSDETSKFGAKYEGVHASDSDGNMWVLGLREIVTKSGKDVLQVFKEILSDIDEVGETSTNKHSRQILKNISSTMSDRAASQAKFNDLLEEFRTDVLKEDLGESWNQMTNAEQVSISKLCNFFCSLHALVHMAETCDKVLMEVEKCAFEDPPTIEVSVKKPGESGTVRLVRTTCKAFARGGDDKSGHHMPFQLFTKDFLTNKKIKSMPLDRFRGNRFNILFQNAGTVFFLKDQISSYLEMESSNRLLSAVKYDISIPEYVAGCKALGLVCELVTSPLWCIIEDTNISLMQSHKIYQEMINYLENLNYTEFILGQSFMSFVDRDKLEQSAVFLSLIAEWEHDSLVHSILQSMIPALLELLQRLFKDFLHSGQWSQPTPELETKTAGVPKHNKFSETIFGHMDRLLREKPNTTIIAMEANIMFVHNKTLEWLKCKTESERQTLLKAASRNAKTLRKKYKIRHIELEAERQRLLSEKLEKQEKARLAKLQRKEDLTNEIQLWGLWQSKAEVDSGLSCLKTKKDKELALKAQLNFRSKVLGQKVADGLNLFKFSKNINGKNTKLTIEELEVNVKQLVHQSFNVSTDSCDLESQLILGKKVMHSFMSGDTGEKATYIGQVISQVPGYPIWFNIKYSGDPAIYTYKLLEDYAAGDLKLCV